MTPKYIIANPPDMPSRQRAALIKSEDERVGREWQDYEGWDDMTPAQQASATELACRQGNRSAKLFGKVELITKMEMA